MNDKREGLLDAYRTKGASVSDELLRGRWIDVTDSTTGERNAIPYGLIGRLRLVRNQQLFIYVARHGVGFIEIEGINLDRLHQQIMHQETVVIRQTPKSERTEENICILRVVVTEMD